MVLDEDAGATASMPPLLMDQFPGVIVPVPPVKVALSVTFAALGARWYTGEAAKAVMAGAATTATEALPLAVSLRVLLATQVRVKVPTMSAVKVTRLEVLPPVMVPLAIDQLKVIPVCSGTEAVSPVVPTVAVEVESVITGVAGAATILTTAIALVLVMPAVFAAVQTRTNVPALPAVKVTLVEVAPAVMVPLAIDQLKVIPV